VTPSPAAVVFLRRAAAPIALGRMIAKKRLPHDPDDGLLVCVVHVMNIQNKYHLSRIK
jgi:hypothetical protein